MSLIQHAKAVEALTRALRPLSKGKELSDVKLLDTLRKVLKAAHSVPFAELISELERQSTEIDQRIAHTLEQRRELLLRSARDAKVPHMRFTNYDQIGAFKVTYKGKKVQLYVGSEALKELEETDGSKLFDVIQKEAEALDCQALSREELFLTLKDALRLVPAQGRQPDGWVPVRNLYPYVVLARQARSKRFLEKPEPSRFQGYSTAQFVYDLARFGREGWSFGNEILRTMTPNMATIREGKAMMLPSFETVEGPGPQLAVLRIDKKEA